MSGDPNKIGSRCECCLNYGEVAQLEMNYELTWNIEDGSTALIKAAKGGHDDCVNKLIEAGANVNIADKRGFRALIFTVKHCTFRTIERLVATGADVNAHNHTALY